MRESGGKHRERIRAHTRNVPRAFLCTGTIPPSIGGLSSLQTLDLSLNRLSGTSCVFLVYVQCDTKRSQLRSESCAGPPLPETLRLLAPLASNLESLNLSDNELGGTITTNIAAFTKLTCLRLLGMGLEGASLGIPRYTAQKRIENPFAQASSRLLSSA